MLTEFKKRNKYNKNGIEQLDPSSFQNFEFIIPTAETNNDVAFIRDGGPRDREFAHTMRSAYRGVNLELEHISNKLTCDF